MRIYEGAELDAMAQAVAAELKKLTADDLTFAVMEAVKNGGRLTIDELAAQPGWSEAKAHAVGFVFHQKAKELMDT